MAEQTQVEIKDKFCLTIDEASAYFNIGEKKLRRIVTDNIDTDRYRIYHSKWGKIFNQVETV